MFFWAIIAGLLNGLLIWIRERLRVLMKARQPRQS
jgi:hypothetical protein